MAEQAWEPAQNMYFLNILILVRWSHTGTGLLHLPMFLQVPNLLWKCIGPVTSYSRQTEETASMIEPVHWYTELYLAMPARQAFVKRLLKNKN